MYKIIHNEKVIDVVKDPHFFRVLSSGNIAFTDKSSAHGIVGSDKATLYAFAKIPKRKLRVVAIEKITLNEFNRLQSLLNSGQEPSADEEALTEAKRNKIAQLSSICNDKITSGFSVVLSNGKYYEFKLTVEDQLNLLALENQLHSNAEFFLYHATGQSCRFFSRTDITKIINTFRQYTTYHTTYFNTAKQYITSLVNIDKVNSFTYGDDVLDTVKDMTIKQILKMGGDF
jgi:hypothetical protein